MNILALNLISYGMYILGTKTSGPSPKINGQIVNTIFQVTAENPVVAVSISKQNLSHAYIEESKVFSVSVLSVDMPISLIGRFGFRSGRELDKFNGINYDLGITGAPLLRDYTIAVMECEVVGSVSVDTHSVFLGRVVSAEITGTGEPMTYAYYHAVKKGTAPPTAPTYRSSISKSLDENQKEMTKMSKYVCKICGYVYDPAVGDPDNDVNPGTPFSEVPEDWTCPLCGAGKEEFEEEG